jgi:hypothetical protein
MSNTDSYTQTTGDWEDVLAAAKENEALLPDLQAERTALEQSLAKAKGLKEQQNSFRAARQATTQDLKQTLVDGRQLAEKVRDAAKFKIGRRSERLVQFKVAPLRKRAPRKTGDKTPPPVTEPTPAPAKPNPA